MSATIAAIATLTCVSRRIGKESNIHDQREAKSDHTRNMYGLYTAHTKCAVPARQRAAALVINVTARRTKRFTPFGTEFKNYRACDR